MTDRHHDHGLFGPDSVTWQVHGHPAMLVGGVRALLLQALHPHAIAGVDQHSDYRTDPLYRLHRTAAYVTTVTYGTTAEAREAGEMVQRVHTHIHGTDPVTGEEYSAGDPEVLTWVHCCEVSSFLAGYRAFVRPMSRDEQDAYLAEQVRAAELVGIPATDCPASVDEFDDYFAAIRHRLVVSAATRRAERFLTRSHRNVPVPARAPMWMVNRAAVAILPGFARQLYGLEGPWWADVPPRLGTLAAAQALTAVGVLMPPPLRKVLDERRRNPGFIDAVPRVLSQAG